MTPMRAIGSASAFRLHLRERVLRVLLPVLPALAVLALASGGAVFLWGCGGSETGPVDAPLAADPPQPATPTATATPTPEPAASPPPPAGLTLASTKPGPKATPSLPMPTSLTRGPASTGSSGLVSGKPTPTPQPEPQPVATPDGPLAKASLGARGAADRGVLHSWQDGARTRRAWLQTGLVLQPSTRNTDDDVVIRGSGQGSIVERTPRHDSEDTQPVFRSEAGTLMTLPGGVVLVLDPDWGEKRINAFFADHGIASDQAEERSFAPNAFLIETSPGFASLELANALAGEEGVLISSPNWRSEIVLR